MIRLKAPYTDVNGGAYFAGHRATLGGAEESRLVGMGRAEYVTAAPIQKPANARAASAYVKKRAIAAEIKRLGGKPPPFFSNIDRFETALRDAREG